MCARAHVHTGPHTHSQNGTKIDLKPCWRPKSGQERPKSGQERPKSGQERPKSGLEQQKQLIFLTF